MFIIGYFIQGIDLLRSVVFFMVHLLGAGFLCVSWMKIPGALLEGLKGVCCVFCCVFKFL